MVVTNSLARGAVREAVRLNKSRVDSMLASLRRERIRAPATHRRFDEWFRTQRHVYEEAALLIVFGKIGRRRGAFSAFWPQFREFEGAWMLDITHLSIVFSPGRLEQVGLELLPVSISGHALERMFQRTDSIQWVSVRDCLAGATLFLNAAIPAYIAARCNQCVIPAEKGVLVGQVVDGSLALRTFLPASALQPRWQTTLSDLNNFSVQHKLAIDTAALTSDDAASVALQELLTTAKYEWLRDRYAPGIDLMEEAWRSKEV